MDKEKVISFEEGKLEADLEKELRIVIEKGGNHLKDVASLVIRCLGFVSNKKYFVVQKELNYFKGKCYSVMRKRFFGLLHIHVAEVYRGEYPLLIFPVSSDYEEEIFSKIKEIESEIRGDGKDKRVLLKGRGGLSVVR